MPDELMQFEDQDLKEAVRRLRGGHTAPPDLRARVLRRLAEAQTALDGAQSGGSVRSPAPTRRWRRPGSRTAIAAVAVVMLCGSLGYLYHQRSQRASADQARNAALLGAMVGIHDLGRGTASGLEPLSAPLSDPAALAADARGRLGRFVPVVDLKARGWTIDAADICNVGEARSVRFRIVRGGLSASVLSIPSLAYADARDGRRYDMMIGGHPIAAFVRDGSLNCVVADPCVGMPETVLLRNAIADH